MMKGEVTACLLLYSFILFLSCWQRNWGASRLQQCVISWQFVFSLNCELQSTTYRSLFI